MPKLKNVPPKLCRIKSSNTAVVYCGGKRIVLGPWGSEKSLQEYSRFLVEWSKADVKETVRKKKEVTTAALIAAFLKWADGTVDPSDFANYRAASKAIRKLYPYLPVAEFGPKALATIQRQMESSGRFSRGYINKLVNYARTIFRWGVGQELVPASVASALDYVQPLRKGRTLAPEARTREDVPDEVVERSLPHLLPTVATMVQVQRYSGMRSGEICKMTVGDIDRSKNIWLYRPGSHKGKWRGHDRVIALGKPEQDLIGPYMVGKTPDQHVFSPREAMEEKRERYAANRKWPQNTWKKKGKPRVFKESYSSQTYANSIKESIKAANGRLGDDEERIPHWTPYQLRHAAVTEITLENNGNCDVARAVAGQKSIKVTQRYNHADVKVAIEQAKKRTAKFGKKKNEDQPQRGRRNEN